MQFLLQRWLPEIEFGGNFTESWHAIICSEFLLKYNFISMAKVSASYQCYTNHKDSDFLYKKIYFITLVSKLGILSYKQLFSGRSMIAVSVAMITQ